MPEVRIPPGMKQVVLARNDPAIIGTLRHLRLDLVPGAGIAQIVKGRRSEALLQRKLAGGTGELSCISATTALATARVEPGLEDLSW